MSRLARAAELNWYFMPVVNYPVVNAIEVVPGRLMESGTITATSLRFGEVVRGSLSGDESWRGYNPLRRLRIELA